MRKKKVNGAKQKSLRHRGTKVTVIEHTKKKLSIIHKEMLHHITSKKLITKIQAEKYLSEISTIIESNECMKYADIAQVTDKLMRQMKTILKGSGGEFSNNDVAYSSKFNKNWGTEELRSSQSTPIYPDMEENIFETGETLKLIDTKCSLGKNRVLNYLSPVCNFIDKTINGSNSKQHKSSTINNITQNEQQKCSIEEVVYSGDNSRDFFSCSTALIYNNKNDSYNNTNDEFMFNTYVNEKEIKKMKTICTNRCVQDFNQHSQNILANYKYTPVEEINSNQTTKLIQDYEISQNNEDFNEKCSHKAHAESVNITSSSVLNNSKFGLKEGTAQNNKKITPGKKTTTKRSKPKLHDKELVFAHIAAEKKKTKNKMNRNKHNAISTISHDKINMKCQNFKNKETTNREPTVWMFGTLNCYNDKLGGEKVISEKINIISEDTSRGLGHQIIKNDLQHPLSADNEQSIHFKNSFDDRVINSINTIPDSENLTPNINYMEQKLQSKIATATKMPNNIIKNAPSKAMNKKKSHKNYTKSLDLSWVQKIKFVRCVDPGEYLEVSLDKSLLEFNDAYSENVLPFINY